jgi:hypothetical protein
MIKALKKRGIEGTYLNIIKAIYDKLIANIILNGEELKPFPIKSGKKTKLSTLPTLIQYSTGTPRQSNKARERSKRNRNKEEVKLSLYAGDMIL